jgi:transposase
MRPDATVFGSPAGCVHVMVKHTSSIPLALRCHANIDVQRQLLRALLGWLRGEKRHCSKVAIPTIEEEDAKRPSRERGSLVTEQTRIVKQIKAILTRFGMRSFRPKLRKAEEHLRDLRTAEGTPLPENTRTELNRHFARLRMVRDQIRAIERERLQKLKADQGRKKGPNAMVHLIARVIGISGLPG